MSATLRIFFIQPRKLNSNLLYLGVKTEIFYHLALFIAPLLSKTKIDKQKQIKVYYVNLLW